MERMTLHEAQAKVAAVYERQGWTAPIDWERPVEAAVYFLHVRANGGDSARLAALDVGRVLLAYHAHLAFEAGRAFSDAASVRHLESEGHRLKTAEDQGGREVGLAFCACADEIRDGLHYAEPEGT